MRQSRSTGTAGRDGEAEVLVRCLRNPRYEVLPFQGIEDAVLTHLGREVKITVTASPRKGLDATLAVSERLARAGYAVVPHVPARLVRDAAQLRDVVLRVRAAGMRELFVPPGDPQQPAGEFAGAATLLAAMGELREEFDDIGITGYPESHHMISDEMTIRAMFEKAPMATYIVSQICFDAQVISTWIERVRARGTHLPIWIGVPGSVDHAKLLRISMKIGLGDSARFLRRHRGWTSRLITRQFRPDALIRDVARSVSNPAANVAGFHFYTFNELRSTERWRRQLLERLGGAP